MKKNILLTVAGVCMLAVTSCKKSDTTPASTPEPAPTITGISPLSGPKATVVTITGTNFGTNPATLKVYFNNAAATVQTATATSITAVVPAGAGTGVVKVEKTPTVSVTGPSFTYHGNGYVTTPVYTGEGNNFLNVTGITKDASGNLFVCDRDRHRIVKISTSGVAAVFAGSGTAGYANGTGSAAQFNQPYCIVADAANNLYVGDRMNGAIRKITPAGLVTTLAGNGTSGSTDGTGTAASFTEPLGIALTSTGNLYVADYGNQKIRKVTMAGVVTTAINGYMSFGVAVDAANVIYFTNYFQNRVFKFTEGSNTPVLVAGDINAGTADGTTVDAGGNLLVTDLSNNSIRKITPAGVVTTVAGGTAGNQDGQGSAAAFSNPIGICGDFSNGAVYIADFANNRLRKLIVE
jgi:sugar lactone lactonase YvrE